MQNYLLGGLELAHINTWFYKDQTCYTMLYTINKTSRYTIHLNLVRLCFTQHHFRCFEGPVVVGVEVPEDAVIPGLPLSEVPAVEVCEAAAIVPPASPAPCLAAVALPQVPVAVPGGEGHAIVNPQRVARTPRVARHVEPVLRARQPEV